MERYLLEMIDKPTGMMILSGILIPLVGVLVYWLRSRVTVSEQGDVAAIREKQTPLDVLRGELTAAKADVTRAQNQLFDFVQSTMERNDAQTRAMLDLASETRAQTEALKVHMDASSKRAENIYGQLGEMNKRVAQIQGHLGAS